MPAGSKKTSVKCVRSGDVLRTNPLGGYWVASIVLATQSKTAQFNELCVVGVTTAVFTREFSLTDLDVGSLRLQRRVNRSRIEVPCLYIYAARLYEGVSVLGSVESGNLHTEPIRFEIGDGQDGCWPSCGKLTSSLGVEAVHEWRRINDHEQWALDASAARQSHEEMLARLKGRKR